MQQHRKSDQYYIDEYDRSTIEKMKELERRLGESQNRFHIDPNDLLSAEMNTDYLRWHIRYNDAGAIFARNKERHIQKRMQADERKDRLIRSTPVPVGIKCSTCFEPMQFKLHDFVGEGDELVFFFFCISGHKPGRAIYSNSNEYYIPVHTCSYCGGLLISKKKQTKTKLIFTDVCKKCGKAETMELDRTENAVLPINDAERKKYCTDFIGRDTFDESLQKIAALKELTDIQQHKITYKYDQVLQLNIAQVEQRLTQQIEAVGFIKIRFETPQASRYLVVEFSAQDSLNRTEIESVKALRKIINKILFPTNWRLMSPGISYKLGFLKSQLKGYSLEEDIIRIAKEITERENR